MTAAELHTQATAEGLTLALANDQISVQGPRRLLARWAPELRQYRDALLAYLRAANDTTAEVDSPRRLWLIHHPDTGWVSHSFTPPATEAEVRAWYPETTIEPEDES